jgi:hypothetical protein
MLVKTIAFHNIYEELNRNNRLFETSDAAIGDDLLLPFGVLREQAKLRGIQVATLPTLAPEDVDAYVFIDMPDPACLAFRQAITSKKPLFLMILESPLVRPQNYDPANLKCFRKIFTYNDSQVDGKRIFKLNYAFRLPLSIPKSLAAKEKLCVMIAGYKTGAHPQELYSERLRAIRWFEEHQPQDFDLFGFGWGVGRLGRHLPGWLTRRLKWLGRLGAPQIPSFRGGVTRKRDVMGRYRFALCYENIKDVPGYITEKIFDAFFAGTVPIYRGADNVTAHIPADCFIDLRSFPDYAALYQYLHEMTDDRYSAYLDSIAAFLGSPQAYQFSCDCFAETLLTEIANGC